MTKPIKEMFRDIVEEWDSYWKDSIEFYDFLENYVEINNDQMTFVIKKKPKGVYTK
jgi:hypothetical protein